MFASLAPSVTVVLHAWDHITPKISGVLRDVKSAVRTAAKVRSLSSFLSLRQKISMRSTGFFSRNDPVMAAILAREDVVPPVSSGSAIAVNGASFHSDQGIAPGSLAAVFGNYSQVPDEVLVTGMATRIVTAGLSQVNFVVPAAVVPGTAAISVRAAGSELASGMASITAAGPGIFVRGLDPSQPGAVENQDG